MKGALFGAVCFAATAMVAASHDHWGAGALFILCAVAAAGYAAYDVDRTRTEERQRLLSTLASAPYAMAWSGGVTDSVLRDLEARDLISVIGRCDLVDILLRDPAARGLVAAAGGALLASLEVNYYRITPAGRAALDAGAVS